MKITIPAIALELGGGTRSLVRIADGLARYGHQVRFLMPTGARIHWPVTVPITQVPALTPQVFPKSDVILANFWPTVLPAYQSQAGQVVRISQGYEPLWVRDEGARASYDLPVPILAISNWLAGLIQADTGKPVDVIPLGVDHDVFTPPAAPSERRGVLYLWRHKSQGYHFKGTDDFMRAIGTVLNYHPDLPITVVTPDRLPIEMPYPCHLVVAPSDAQLAELYRQASLFVSTSWFEAFSMAPLEAMACGCPVVSTDCGGVSEYARDGENCLLVPTRSPNQLAQGMLRLLNSPALGQQLAAKGIETAQQWTWTRTWDAVHTVLQALVAKPSG
jgi:glycosyltransferase involved in cell wall biosynthesis